MAVLESAPRQGPNTGRRDGWPCGSAVRRSSYSAPGSARLVSRFLNTVSGGTWVEVHTIV
eukprot:6942726-Prymnesium_polylepis.3